MTSINTKSAQNLIDEMGSIQAAKELNERRMKQGGDEMYERYLLGVQNGLEHIEATGWSA